MGKLFLALFSYFAKLFPFFQQANKTEIGHIWLKMIIRLRPQGTLHNEKFGQIFSANYESIIHGSYDWIIVLEKCGLNWQRYLAGSSKMAPKILIFSIVMGAKPSF